MGARCLTLAWIAIAAAVGSIDGQPPASARRTVDGRVLDGSADQEAPVIGHMVVLHRIAADGAGPLDSVRTDRDGRYRFRYPYSGDDAVYIVSARYAGVAYFTPPLRANNVTGDDAVVLVFDTTSRPIPLHVRGRHIVVSAPQPNGARQLTEVFEIANDTIVTKVPGSSGRTWSARLPAGARGFEVGRGDIRAEAVRFARDSVHVAAPFAPGFKQLVLRYEMPRSTFPLDMTLGQDVAVLEVLLEDSTARAAAPGLARQDPVSLEGRQYERYLAQDVAGGTVLHLAAAPVARGPGKTGVAAILAAAVALALGTRIGRRRVHTARPSLIVAPASSERDTLAAAIAALDNVMEGQLAETSSPRSALETRRAELEARLVDVLARERRPR